MVKYEAMILLDPTLEDAQRDAMIETIKGIIAADGEVGEVNIMGIQKTAYPINKKNEAFYFVIEFAATPQLPKELDRRLKISDNVMRHIIINKDEK